MTIHSRMIFGTSAIPNLMIRGPRVMWSPDEDAAPEISAADAERAEIAAQNGDEPEPVEPEVTTPEPDPAAAGEDPEPKPEGEKKPKTDWAHRRIDRVTREREEARAEAKEAREEAARYRAIVEGAGAVDGDAGDNPTPPPPTALSEADVDRRAREIVAEKTFTDKCNAVAETGKGRFEDWADTIANLGRMGVLTEQGGPVLNAALETDAPEVILHHLGSNPDEAERIAALSPTRMAIEMDRLAGRLKTAAAPKPTPISKVPAPMTPVDGARAGNPIDIYDPGISDEDFFAQRERQTKGMAPGQR